MKAVSLATMLAPAVPTTKESGIDMEAVVWYGLFAPKATPREVVTALSEAINRAAQAPDAFDKFVLAERAQWAEVVRLSGAKAE